MQVKCRTSSFIYGNLHIKLLEVPWCKALCHWDRSTRSACCCSCRCYSYCWCMPCYVSRAFHWTRLHCCVVTTASPFFHHSRHCSLPHITPPANSTLTSSASPSHFFLKSTLDRTLFTVLITPGGRSVDSTWWIQILAGNSEFCLPHLHSTSRRNIAVTFGMEKLEWFFTRRWKLIWIYVYSFRQNARTWQTDWRTDRQTDTAWRIPGQ